MIGSDVLSLVRNQVITLTDAGALLIGFLRKKFGSQYNIIMPNTQWNMSSTK